MLKVLGQWTRYEQNSHQLPPSPQTMLSFLTSSGEGGKGLSRIQGYNNDGESKTHRFERIPGTIQIKGICPPSRSVIQEKKLHWSILGKVISKYKGNSTFLCRYTQLCQALGLELAKQSNLLNNGSCPVQKLSLRLLQHIDWDKYQETLLC